MPNEHKLSLRVFSAWQRGVVLLIGAILCAIAAVFLVPVETKAAQTVPYKMNFQGRLTNSSGNIMPDGLYNMRFRIFDAATGGSQQWSELRETTSRVQVTNGLFSVQLGDVTVLPIGIFTNQNLYFEIELPTPGTATCSTAGCASFTEGPMTPRQQLAASAYAMNADTVDGIDGASLAQVGVANTFTAAQTINVNNTAALDVKSGATSLLLADTTNSIVKIGTTGSATLGTSVRLLSTSAEFSGTVRVGDATNGVDISASGVVLNGTAQPLRKVTLSPEFVGATFTGDGTSNNGSLKSDFCSPAALLNINASECTPGTGTARSHNYYQWSTTQTSLQDYDIYVRYQMPSDYSSGSMADFTVWGHGTNGANSSVVVSMYTDSSATACFTSGDAAYNTAEWRRIWVVSPLGSCSIAAGDYVTFKITLAANNTTVKVSDLTFSYRSKF